MTEFAIVDDGRIVEFRHLDEAPVLAGKPYRRFLPVVVTDPAYDPVEQTRSGPVVTIEADRVTRLWTVASKSAPEKAAELEQLRDAVIAPIDTADDVLRAVVLMLLDELNLHSTRFKAVLDAAAGASTLAGFKTAMAAIQSIPQRTPAEVRAAIRAKVARSTKA